MVKKKPMKVNELQKSNLLFFINSYDILYSDFKSNNIFVKYFMVVNLIRHLVINIMCVLLYLHPLV